MANKAMSTIRLAVNAQLEDVMTYLEREYKPMSRAEILKMGLSELVRKSEQSQLEVLDKETSDELHKALKDIEDGKYKTFRNSKELIKYLKS